MRTVNQQATILYVHYGDDWIRGSEVVLLDMLKSALAKGYRPILWCNSQVLTNKAQALGIEVITEPLYVLAYWLTPRWHILGYVKQLSKTLKLLKQYQVALVHCNNGAPCQWLAPICKFKNIPLVLHLHARYQYRDRLTLLFQAADAVVGVSKAVINSFNAQELKKNKHQVIYNGIAAERVQSKNPIDIRALVNAKQGDYVLLYLGSLIKRKGLALVIKAIANLTPRFSIKLAIFGDGEDKQNLEKLTQQFALHNHVYFFSPVEDVAKVYTSNADCFISTPAEEVFGLTLAEASLAQLPIISSDIVGVNEIYQHGVNASLIPCQDLEALAAAIKNNIVAPNVAKQRAQRAQQDILAKFSLQQQFERFDVLYKQLMKQPTKQSLLVTLISHIYDMSQALLVKISLKIKLKISAKLKKLPWLGFYPKASNE